MYLRSQRCDQLMLKYLSLLIIPFSLTFTLDYFYEGLPAKEKLASQKIIYLNNSVNVQKNFRTSLSSTLINEIYSEKTIQDDPYDFIVKDVVNKKINKNELMVKKIENYNAFEHITTKNRFNF